MILSPPLLGYMLFAKCRTRPRKILVYSGPTVKHTKLEWISRLSGLPPVFHAFNFLCKPPLFYGSFSQTDIMLYSQGVDFTVVLLQQGPAKCRTTSPEVCGALLKMHLIHLRIMYRMLYIILLQENSLNILHMKYVLYRYQNIDNILILMIKSQSLV